MNEEAREEVSADGVYRTPQAAIDAVTANQPMGEPTAGTGALPRVDEAVAARLKRPWSAVRLADIPELGIEFRQFSTPMYYKFVSRWHDADNNDAHVYELTVSPTICTGWRASATNDGREIFTLDSASKVLAIQCGLDAMHRYLMRGHRAAWRTWRKARKEAEPLTPEEELAATIARQKGEEPADA